MSKAVFVLAVALSMGLSACAGTVNVHPDSVSKTSLTSRDLDMEKVAIVNRWAFNHGHKLIWVNYPQKLLAVDDGRAH
jgi:hypothetical protein